MVDLMLDHPREHALGFQGEQPATPVARLDADMSGPLHVGARAGDAQAALLAALGLDAGADDLGVDEYPFPVVGRPGHEQAHQPVDLGGSKTDPCMLLHHGQHIVGEAAQLRRHFRHRIGTPAERGVAKRDNF